MQTTAKLLAKPSSAASGQHKRSNNPTFTLLFKEYSAHFSILLHYVGKSLQHDNPHISQPF